MPMFILKDKTFYQCSLILLVAVLWLLLLANYRNSLLYCWVFFRSGPLTARGRYLSKISSDRKRPSLYLLHRSLILASPFYSVPEFYTGRVSSEASRT